MSLTDFAHSLRDSREVLMDRWLQAVRGGPSNIPSARDLPALQLRDHLPDLLDDIIAAIADEPAPPVEAEAREHGRQRWGTGYDIEEVLRELAVLRDLLLEVVEEGAAGAELLTNPDRAEARRRILRVIDRSAQAGAAQYHAEALSVRRQLWEELESAHLQLKSANDQKDRFLAMLSHELRNPLSPILTAVQLLEFSEGSDPRLQRAREVIERQVRHQARLIDDLLDINRIASGKIVLRREPHILQDAITYAVEGCLREIQARGQELLVTTPDEPLPVDADPVRLEQVITNLLTNACKYTPAGGRIWLIAAIEGAGCQVSGEGPDGPSPTPDTLPPTPCVAVRVRDNGIGISPEMLPRVFDLFTQADTSLNRTHGGLGIGLTLVKTLVELHGGSVQAESAGLGHGSEFVIRLPLARAEAKTPSPSAAARAPSTTTRRIVIVEDNPDARATLAELLELLEHEVVAVPDGAAALALARAESLGVRPQAFVIDIGLPGMDGNQVARSLRQLPGGDRLLLIALSGYGSAEEKEQALEAGFDAHLTKPANTEELQRLLSRPA